ncbi:periplasmic Cu(I)/Cu(II)-binding protein CopK [Ralstonia sp. SET104]|uniref:periplasmic Cu(I)/Cu(II)-binding protein CopK n=1 Tax=Ralstonia sp. SET104 TaxID=2448774 RepID=UPI000F57DDDE|nr:periplasmic Cu(I)/Cu(II)-binding protein CopK [Ralstonia sp. SET104]GCB05274.1 hypothetical protein PSUB009319_29050 [Ralstonia sp. SET104]
MYRDFVIAAVVAVAPLFAFAADIDMRDVVKTYELKDGSTVYVFRDGKMGVESKFGRAVRVKEGQVLETKDGTTIVMKGNAVARMDALLKESLYGYGGR